MIPRGGVIFSEGDEAAGFYVVSAGKIKIYKLSMDGKEQILHFFGPGELFGEVPVFAGKNFPAYAQALADSEVLFFPRMALIEQIHKDPDLALGLLAVLSLRLRMFTNLIEDLSLKEVPSRLAAYILYLSDRQQSNEEVNLDITKSQLASLLGTIPETLSRVLGKMSSAGLVESDGRRLKILDFEALEDLSRAFTRL